MARSIRVNARVTPELKAALEVEAKATDWSESLIVQKALELWLHGKVDATESKPKAR
jgi:hypothetical protein